MSVLIRIVSRATGEPSADDGLYIGAFDPRPLPHGSVRLTNERRNALRFISTIEALEFWRQEHGMRPDGRPNRPLTAWTVTIEPGPMEDVEK